MNLDPELHRRFTEAFEAAFAKNDTTAVIQLSEYALEPDGGFLHDSYCRDAPENWRINKS